MPPEITTYKMRPVFSQKPEADGIAGPIVPEHAKHLEPSCTPGSLFRSPSRSASFVFDTRKGKEPVPEDILRLPPLTVYVSLTQSAEDNSQITNHERQLPYMSWMEYGEYSVMKAMYDSSIEAAVKRKLDSSAAKKKRPPKILPDASHGTSEPFYLVDGKTSWPTTPPSQGTKRPQYLRRTLDQFYYPALDDTSARDGDQTISKWSGTPLKHNGRDKAVPDSAMIMVDQFWCWIIDESLSSVLLTLLSIAN